MQLEKNPLTNSTDDTGKSVKAGAGDNMAGLAKGLKIIEAFGTEHVNLTITKAAEAVGSSRASARRCLLTLLDLGYVVKNGSAFRPTPRLLRLGAAYYETATLPQLAQMYLDSARDELQESVSLAVLDDYDPVFVARAEAEKIVSTLAQLGRRLTGYSSATGRVLLSALPDDELRTYLKELNPVAHTMRTITGKSKLKAIILKARNERVAMTDEELELGMVAMAIPVTDHNEQIVAAMSVSAARARISPKAMKSDILPVLRKYAQALSQTL